MNWFKREKDQSHGVAVQVRDGGSHPFGGLEQVQSKGEMTLYRTIREAVPIIDAALLKIVRLSSGITIETRDERAQKAMDRFLQEVNTGRGQRGIQSFLDSYLDSMLTYGRGVGEIVLDGKGRHVVAVLSADPCKVLIKEGETPLDFTLCLAGIGGEQKELPWQDLLLFTPFQAEVEHPYGVSMLRSMPFLTEILLKIYHAVGKNWERMGNVRFAVLCKPEEDERSSAEERCRQIASEWSAAMQSSRSGAVRDFVAVGDVDIQVIGADNQVLDSQVPVRQILEQLVARTGIPPFMLGLSWSSTERMSAQQADILTSEITSIRRSLEGAIRQIAQTFLRMEGYSDEIEIHWGEINLQDQVEEAKAALYLAQAKAQLRGKSASELGDDLEGDLEEATGEPVSLEG
ncbi:MAG: serine/threonine protein phosphatase [Eubacteriales bacterium]